MYTDELICAEFKTIPYAHQYLEFEQSCEQEAKILLWQMRTGKTKVMIDTACHLYKKKLINCVIVIAPNGVHENWIDRELILHHWDLPYSTSTWDTEIASKKALTRVKAHERENWHIEYEKWWENIKILLKTNELTWFSFATETMIRTEVRNIIKRIVRHKKILVIFDECHDFRGPGTKQSQMARALAKKAAYKRALTGTATDNSPLHSWAQYELLGKEALGFETYTDFKHHFAEYTIKKNSRNRSYPVLSHYKNLYELTCLMAKWSSVVLRSDCLDLPDLVPITHNVELTEQQQQLYKELHSSFILELNNESISVGENTTKFIKLQQIVSGFIKDEYGVVHNIEGGNPKMDALIKEIESTSEKVIIWCVFHEDMDRIATMLTERGHKFLQYHGRVSSKDKAKTRHAFVSGAKNDYKALIGYPTPGLNLSAAGKIIWYSHTFDAIKRQQADERATEIGGKNIPVIDLVAGGIDGYILSNIKAKISVANTLTRTGMKQALNEMAI